MDDPRHSPRAQATEVNGELWRRIQKLVGACRTKPKLLISLALSGSLIASLLGRRTDESAMSISIVADTTTMVRVTESCRS